MASPKTRRVLAELRPRDENDVSKIYSFFFRILIYKIQTPKSVHNFFLICQNIV